MELNGQYTSAGLALLSRCLSGEGLRVTQVRSSGHLTSDIKAADALTDPVQSLSLLPMETTPDGNTLPAVLTASLSERAYDLQELGVFAAGPDGTQVLLCIYQLDAPVHIDPASRLVLRFLLTFLLSDAPALTVTPSPSGLATVADLLEERRLWPNKNLLDNWDFQVWQRYPDGVYEGVLYRTYIADRFKIASTNDSESNRITRISGGGIKNESGPSCGLQYWIENAEMYNGKTMTFSALTESGYHSKTFTPSGWAGNTDILAKIGEAWGMWLYEGGTIYRMKLELGSVSTLANDPPADYGEELRKCQRYFQKCSALNHPCGASTGHVIPGFVFPVRMRTAPAIKIYDQSGNAGVVGTSGISNFASVSSAYAEPDGISYINTTSNVTWNSGISVFGYEASAEL